MSSLLGTDGCSCPNRTRSPFLTATDVHIVVGKCVHMCECVIVRTCVFVCVCEVHVCVRRCLYMCGWERKREGREHVYHIILHN